MDDSVGLVLTPNETHFGEFIASVSRFDSQNQLFFSTAKGDTERRDWHLAADMFHRLMFFLCEDLVICYCS